MTMCASPSSDRQKSLIDIVSLFDYTVWGCDYIITLIFGSRKYQVTHMMKARLALCRPVKDQNTVFSREETEELKYIIHSKGTGNFSEEKVVHKRSATYWSQKKNWIHPCNSEAKLTDHKSAVKCLENHTADFQPWQCFSLILMFQHQQAQDTTPILWVENAISPL